MTLLKEPPIAGLTTTSIKALPDIVNKPKKKSKKPGQKKGSEEAISQILHAVPSGSGNKTPLSSGSSFAKTVL